MIATRRRRVSRKEAPLQRLEITPARLYELWKHGNQTIAEDSFNTLLQALGGERRINYALDRFQNALESVGNPEKEYTRWSLPARTEKAPPLFLSPEPWQERVSASAPISPRTFRARPSASYGIFTPSRKRSWLPWGWSCGSARSHCLSYFEFLTLLSFIWAKRRGADIHVLEVGLGGRLDATNVTDPLACAITNISLDHESYLGNMKELILREKLGVLRPEGLLFTRNREPDSSTPWKALLELDVVYYFSKEMKRSY